MGANPAPRSAPAAVIALGVFFASGAVVSAASFVALLTPGGFLERLWRLNPRAHQQFQAMGATALVLMGIVCILCAATTAGLWLGRRWGYLLGITLLATSLLGDLANALLGLDRRAWVGVPIAAALLALLATRRARVFFQAPVRPDRTLSAIEARAYYDRFGAKQDSQGFYEDPALDDLIAHAGFETAQRLFEFGCGTGKLAQRLLSGHLPDSATYLGCDVSPTMVEFATRRLAPYRERARALQSDGAARLPLADHSVDRVVSSYVLDLLSEPDVAQFFAEAHRVLETGGRLCLVSLTEGVNPPSRIVAGLWMRVFRWHPAWVGGCRPIRLERCVDAARWRTEYRAVKTAFGVPSEVLVLAAVP